MKVLIDEMLDERLVALIPNQEVKHVHHMGWDGLKNGALMLAAATEGFQAIVSGDKKMPFQQNMKDRPFALIILDIHPNKFSHQVACLPALIALFDRVQPSEIHTIQAPS